MPGGRAHGAAARAHGGSTHMVKSRLILATAALLSMPVLLFGQLAPPAPPVISDPSTLTAAYEALVGKWLASRIAVCL